MIMLAGCLLSGGGCSLAAQSVHVSVWSSAIDHSLESALVFRSQSPDEVEAVIHIYEDVLDQQIANIGMETPSGASDASSTAEAPPSMDQEADNVIVNPLQTGAVDVHSAFGANIDFLLITQLSIAVRPMAYRMAAEVTGSRDVESLAFRNPDGTRVLFTVNHSKQPISLEAFWKERLFTYTQAGNSVALFVWNPKSQLVSLVARKQQVSSEDTLSLEAKCSQNSPLGIDLRCESPAVSCSVFPVYFTCDSQQDSVPLVVTVGPIDNNSAVGNKLVFITITAAPDVGELTRLRVSSAVWGGKGSR